MLIPDGEAEFELVVKRSRFLARVVFIESADAARAEVKRLKAEYPDATHVVHACICGPAGDLFSFSDDREPKGTAGRPVLEILKGSGITDILVTVIRWFGGTKLGTGGLVKAYGDSAKGVLSRLKTSVLEERRNFTIRLDYRYYEQVCDLIVRSGGRVVDSDFATAVTLSGTIGVDACTGWLRALEDMTCGGVEITIS